MYPYIYLFNYRISSYGLLMCVACVLVGTICLCRVKSRGVVPEDVLIVGACALGIGLFLGGLFFVIITYPLPVIWENIIRGRFEMFFGGIVFYGGLVGGIVGALLGCKVAGCSYKSIIQVVVPYIPLGHGIGRIGCVLAGCCNGMPYNGPFALYISSNETGVESYTGHFPVQIVETLINLGLCFFLHKYERNKGGKYLLELYLLIYSIARFGLEFLRGDDIRGITGGLSTSQWISIFLIGVSVVRIIFEKYLKKEHR